ncbi:MAG TPA: hypothetical protein VNS58_12980 [Puia sp.]|nr:hypothetical protein [Puia sp.]
MNKTLRPGSWILPALALLVIFCTFALSGCHETVCPETVLNEDSIKPHAISIADAALLTSHFRNTVDTFDKKCPGFKDSLKFGYSEAFNGETYRILLRQKDSLNRPAAGIRIYYGLGKDGQVKLVMVPIDSNGNDILRHLIDIDKPVPGVSPAHTEALSVTTAQAMEQGQLCPTICPPAPSPLEP